MSEETPEKAAEWSVDRLRALYEAWLDESYERDEAYYMTGAPISSNEMFGAMFSADFPYILDALAAAERRIAELEGRAS